MQALAAGPGANAGHLASFRRFPNQAFPATRAAGGLAIGRGR
jgi:hypothetical protein